MNRREAVRLLLCGLAAALPLRAWAQGARAPVIGFLNTGSLYEWSPFVTAFRAGLGEMGYVEGRNAAIEFRWAFGDNELLPSLARDLVDRRVDTIVATGGNPAILAAKNLTTTIPIVATFGNDPVKRGLIDSLERPGRNVTGVSLIAETLETKQFELMRQVASKSAIALLVDPAPTAVDMARYKDAAGKAGQPLTIVTAGTEAELDKAFASLMQRGIGGLVIASTAYFLGRRDRLAALAARYAIPTMYPARAYVDSGGLISYGVDRQESYRELGVYAARIIRDGVSPSNLPVRQQTKFELAVNLKTAKALGVAIPPALVTVADVVIQ